MHSIQWSNLATFLIDTDLDISGANCTSNTFYIWLEIVIPWAIWRLASLEEHSVPGCHHHGVISWCQTKSLWLMSKAGKRQMRLASGSQFTFLSFVIYNLSS